MATELKRSDGLDPIIGDAIPLTLTITVPAGITLSKAWWTFKRSLSDLDAAAIVQKTTTSFTGTTTVVFSFTLSKTDTALFTAGKRYYWDVQAIDSGGNPATIIPDGEVIWRRGVTDASV